MMEERKGIGCTAVLVAVVGLLAVVAIGGAVGGAAGYGLLVLIAGGL